LLGVLVGLWLAAFYSGNNLLYLCGAVLTALSAIAIWQGVRLLKLFPPIVGALPASMEAGEVFVLRKPVTLVTEATGVVDVKWFYASSGIELQARLEKSALLTGRMQAEKRGYHQLRRQTLMTTAPLGLWRIRHIRSEEGGWAVLPRPVPWMGFTSGGSSHQRQFEGDDLHDLRGYVPGDALSRIHWRKSASEMTRWSVKRFEQHQQDAGSVKLRVDLRLPKAAGEQAFEDLLGRAWYWVDSYLKRGETTVQVVFGDRHFDLTSDEQRQLFFIALADAEPQLNPPSDSDGLLLSLVEGQ